MKAKLKRSKTQYILCVKEESINRFKSSLDTTYGWVVADEYGEDILKLSKQNCDEIFGIIDVEKLADEYLEKHFSTGLDTNYIQNIVSDGIKYGFNKAMALNKDKVFTRQDVEKVIEMSRKGSMVEQHNGYGRPIESIFVLDNLPTDEIIQSLQQPTEIDVEIEMETIYGIFDYKELRKQLKLDSSGNLILKKI
jgi:hypothetical protein